MTRDGLGSSGKVGVRQCAQGRGSGVERASARSVRGDPVTGPTNPPGRGAAKPLPMLPGLASSHLPERAEARSTFNIRLSGLALVSLALLGACAPKREPADTGETKRTPATGDQQPTALVLDEAEFPAGEILPSETAILIQAAQPKHLLANFQQCALGRFLKEIDGKSAIPGFQDSAPAMAAEGLLVEIDRLDPRHAFAAVTTLDVDGTSLPAILVGFQSDAAPATVRAALQPACESLFANHIGMADLLPHWVGDPGEGERFEIETFSTGDFAISYASVGTWHLAATDLDTLRDAIDAATGNAMGGFEPLSGNPEFGQILTNLEDDSEAILYARIAGSLRERVVRALQAAGIASPRPALHPDAAMSLGLSLRFKGTSMRERVCLLSQSPAPIWAGRPPSLRGFPHPDSFLSASIPADIDTLLRGLNRSSGSPAIHAFLDRLKAQGWKPGALRTSGAVLSIDWPATAGAPVAQIAWKTRDTESLRNLLNACVDDSSLHQLGSPGTTGQAYGIGKAAADSRFGIVLRGPVLVLTTDTEYTRKFLEEAIDARIESPSDSGAVDVHPPRFNAVVDIARLAPRIADIIAPPDASDLCRVMFSNIFPPLNLAILPRIRASAKGLSPSVLTGELIENGCLFKAEGSVTPGFALGAIVSGALAREAAE